MRSEQGSKNSTTFREVMTHEFGLCEKSFNDCISSASIDNDDYETKQKQYNSYSDFIEHLYEFYVACFKKQRGKADKINFGDMDCYLGFEVEKLMHNICVLIEGAHPDKIQELNLNDLSYYQEPVPYDFGEKFRGARNNSSHVDSKRAIGSDNRCTLMEFFTGYHKFILLLYYAAGDFWATEDNPPQHDYIKDFSFSF